MEGYSEFIQNGTKVFPYIIYDNTAVLSELIIFFNYACEKGYKIVTNYN